MANIVNQYGQVKLGVRYALAPLTSSYLLDTYTGAAAAYSLRKLSNTYSGAAIRVRRSSDNTTLDVGFNANGELDTTALLAFVGAGNGFVSIWYDQSGNGRNITQSTSIRQPQIVSSGNLILENGKVSVNFDGVNHRMYSGALTNWTNQGFSTYVISKSGGLDANGRAIFSISNGADLTNGYLHLLYRSDITNKFRVTHTTDGAITNSQSQTPLSTFPTTQNLISTTRPASGNIIFRLNNNLQSTIVASALNTGSPLNGNFILGNYYSQDSQSLMFAHQGTISEVIVYPNSQGSNTNGINTNINSYYSIYTTDVDAQAFITAAAITDTTQQSAITTLVTDLKGYGIWSKMKALYPFVGGTAAQHRFNLKDPRTVNAAFYLDFSGGGTHSATGYQLNGSTSYANTWLAPSNTLNASSSHLSFYSRTNSDCLYEMGSYSSSNNNQFAILTKYTNKFYSVMGNTTTPNVANTNGMGMYVSNRNSSTNTTGYKNGTGVIDIAQTGGLPTSLLFIGVLSYNSIPLTGNYSNKECAFASIGDGLTDTEATALYTAVQKYQTTLGRQV